MDVGISGSINIMENNGSAEAQPKSSEEITIMSAKKTTKGENAKKSQDNKKPAASKKPASKKPAKKSEAAQTVIAEEVSTNAAAPEELPLAVNDEPSNEEHVTMSEIENTQATETTTPTAEAPKPPRKIERRVYVGHKLHGTCVTFDAVVYLAPAGMEFAPKSAPRLNFTVGDGALTDDGGGVWLASGENPGCGPRCPVSLREKYGQIWRNLSHADRAEIIKALVPAPEAK